MSEIKRRLMLWASGVERATSANRLRTSSEAVVVEDATHVADLEASGVVNADSVVFTPAGTDVASSAEIVEYTGDAWGGVNEFGLGDSFILQSLQYGTMRFVPAFGPTVVRVDSDEDFAAFLADADTARETGAFAAFLKHPMNRLADQASLGAPVVNAGPSQRLHVAADGTCSTSASGLAIGDVGTSLLDLRSSWMERNAASAAPCATGLGARLDEGLRAAAVAERPWLGDYLDAVEVMQHGEARGFAGLKVSGYGGRLSPVLDADDAGARRHGPVVAWNDELCFVHDVESSRSMAMSVAAGRVVDLLAWSSSLEEAGAHESPEVLQGVCAHLARNGLSLDLAEVNA